ncbi:hypothetical protein DH2020_036565 [Rehmannia glutinosa]|uniref:NFACT RNA-binding domain-containing protein n=1 Tax=Rehmannia glutinosa TaxID=99300 RepID=A0ABR0V3B9_REHGL
MVFYFKARPEAGDYTIFMGLDKYENEELIKYGFPEDIWFHVDKMSSAHVYLRLHKGQSIDDISEGVLEDCVQLVKANSIQGNNIFIELGDERSFISFLLLGSYCESGKADKRAEREAVSAAERAERKQQLRDKTGRVKELQKLDGGEKMTSNKDIASTNKSLQELEEDFM